MALKTLDLKTFRFYISIIGAITYILPGAIVVDFGGGVVANCFHSIGKLRYM